MMPDDPAIRDRPIPACPSPAAVATSAKGRVSHRQRDR